MIMQPKMELSIVQGNKSSMKTLLHHASFIKIRHCNKPQAFLLMI